MDQKTTPQQALELYLLDCGARRLAPSTVVFYRAKLRPFVAWLESNGAPTAGEIATSHVRGFLAALAAREVSPQYQHNHARAIKAFVRFLEREGLILRAPHVPMPRLPKRILPSLTPAQVRSVLNACAIERDKAIVLMLLDTGLRASELVGLSVGDIDIAQGSIHVRSGKGQKDRIVYAGFKTRKALLRYFTERGATGSHAPAFASLRDGGRLTVWGLAQLLERLRHASGVEELTAHALRRTFALACLRGGMNVYVLARLMGHADIQVLRYYLALVESDLAAAHGRAGPVDHMK